MLNLVLFGPPGAGKGTQSQKLIDKYNLVHLSTGDILRSEIVAGTALGMEAKKLMDEGILVPDDVVIGMIRSRLDQNKNAKGFIFDGFPRTTAQAEALDKLLAEKDTSITMMIALEVNDEELTKRLLLRGSISGRADDMNEEVIQNRIAEYNKKTAPLKEYYTAQNKFSAVYGIGEIGEIFGKLCDAIDAKERVESHPSLNTEKPVEGSIVAKVIDKVKKLVTGRKVFPPKTVQNTAARKKTESKKSDRPAVKQAAKKTTAKKAAKKVEKKVAAKKTAAKTSAKKVAKKIARKTVVKKVGRKAIKNAPKKVVKKVAKKLVKKVAKQAPKKTIAKKIVKKPVKKAAKKPAKKQVRKTTAKRSAKKVLKVVKRAVKKTSKVRPVKKAAKKTGKKAVKNTVKKAVKKAVKKTTGRKAVKKAVKKGRRK